ncbi:hypothetical protein ACSW9K_08325 [Clostridium perfringens]
MRRKTHEEFVREIKGEYGDEYTVLNEYKGAHIKILVRHNSCRCNNYEWEIAPNKLLQGRGCPICANNIKKTHEGFVKELNEVHGENIYIPLEKYKGSNTKILVRHNCGYEWEVTPSSLLSGKGCYSCRGSKKKTHEEFIEEVKEKYNGEYTILSKYVNARTKILIKHNSDKCKFHKYEVTPDKLLIGKGCPVCSGRTAKLGINTIWDTDRWMCDLGVSEEDAKKYSSRSGRKITVTCLDCGRKKDIVIHQLFRNKSISCLCGDGKSYPEKFIYNLLEQLKVDFEIEYKPEWIDNKRYDFHIKDYSCIIETHGGQHYEESFQYYGGRTLEGERQNDKYKKEAALKNGIKYYITLDCRESNLEWIKNSVLNSELAELFDLSSINLTSCAEFANKNIVKEVCDYWNNKREDETTADLERVFRLNRTSISAYLKKGTRLGWCNYNPKEEVKKIVGKNGKLNGKEVEIFKDNQSLGIFESCAALSRQSEKLFGVKLFNQNISAVCNGKQKSYKGFAFKYIE